MAEPELLLDDSGQAIIRQGGQVTLTNVENARRLVAQGRASAATADDVSAHNDVEAGGALGAAGRGAAAGVAGGLLSLPKAVTALGSMALGTEDPLAPLSGRQFVEDIGALGADDVVQGANETRAQLEEDMALHPLAFGGGELAGNLVGGSVYGTGFGALGKLGAAKAGLQGAWATRGATALAGGLEGSALGADAVAEEAWVRDEVATAEHTLAGMGLGALLGSGVAVGVGAAGQGLAKLFGRGAKAADNVAGGIEGAADDITRRSALVDDAGKVAPLESVSEKASTKADSWLSKLSDDAAVADIARQDQKAMREIGGLSGDAAATRRVGQILKETGITQRWASAEQKLARAEQVAAQSGKQVGDVIAKIQQKGGFVDGRTLFAKVDEHIDRFRGGLTPEMEGIATQLDGTVAKIRQFSDMGALEQTQLHQFRRELDKSIKWASQAKNPAQAALKGLRGIVEDQIESEVSRIGQETGERGLLKEYERAKQVFRASRWAEETLAKRAGVRDPANRFFSLTDYGVGLAGAVSMGPAGALLGGAAALGNKLARERGAGLVADVASRFARESVDTVAAPAGAQGTARSLRTLLGHVDEQMTGKVKGFFQRFDVPAESRRGARTATALSERPAFMEGSPRERRKAYAAHAEQVARMATMPEVAASGLLGLTGGNLPGVAPKLNAAMAATVARAASYLQANAPAPAHDPNSITPHLADPPPVSDADLNTYAKRVEGVTNPLSLLADLERGNVSPVKVEAVKTVWPQLYEGMRAKVFAELTMRTTPVPREARKVLDIALDANGLIEPSLSPRFLATMQQVGAQTEQPPQGPQPGPTTNVASTLSTRSEQIASR